MLLQRSFSEGLHGLAGLGTAQAANTDVNAAPYAAARLLAQSCGCGWAGACLASVLQTASFARWSKKVAVRTERVGCGSKNL